MSKKRKRRTGKNGAALQAAISLAFVAPAAAQPAPNARPQGGQVVAGGASIATGAATTTINQSTARAAIDWRSFDVGSNQSVIFQQPGASSVTLNRVTGPDPSAIAGRISANGQLVLTNPSGVTFYAGSQVNAQSVIVSAPGITNQNFMAGRMVFDQPGNPNARIENAGTITVKEAGLAALVAPSVANSGTITARLGHVVLAGAAAHTIDMYGDGLVSIDITKQVTQAPVGADGKAVTALVTNTGTIAADGGTVQLTARAADGVVNTLVQAGGRIQANTAGGRTGQIEITGTGGSVVIEGRVAADGRAPGTTGGSVVAAGSDATVIASTARVSANGRTGGGTVAIGTSLARARGTGAAPAGTSARTAVAAGARISADATASGDGGRVTVLSTDSTIMAGAITARGGPTAGNGGTIELSGETGFRLTGSADTSAPHGTLGTIVLDPRDLTITGTANGTTNLTPTSGTIAANAGGTGNDAYVTPLQLQALTGNVDLQATRDLVVASNISFGQSSAGGGAGGGNLTLEAGRNLTVNSGVTISVPGGLVGSTYTPGVLTLSAATSTIAGFDPTGTLTVAGTLNASNLVLKAGTGGIALSGALASKTYAGPTNLVDAISLTTTGAVTQTAGSLTTNSLSGTASSLSLGQTGNQIATIGGATSLISTAGGITITNNAPLTVTAGATTPGIVVAAAQTISLTTDTLTLTAGGAGVPVLSAPNGVVNLQPYSTERGIVLTSSTTKPQGALALTTTETGLINAGLLQLSGNSADVTIGQVSETTPVDLVAHGNFALQFETGGTVTQNTALVVSALSGSVGSITLQNAGNVIPNINGLVANGGLAFSTSGSLSINGTVTADGTTTIGSSGSMAVPGGTYISGPNGVNLVVDNAGTGSLTIGGTVTSNRGVALTAGSGGISLSGSVVPAQSLQITSAGPLTETATGFIEGGTLSGTASSVSLLSTINTVDLVSGFTVTSPTGDFLLVNNKALQVYAQNTGSTSFGISVPTGRTVSLVSDSVQLLSAGGGASVSGGSSVSGGLAISAPSGTLVLAPYTAGGGVLLTSGTAPTTGLSITMLELNQVTATTLQLGGTPGNANVPVAGTITIGQAGDDAIDLGSLSINKVTLNASGAVTQNAALGVTTLAGGASTLALANVGNFINELNGFTATAGDIALHTSSGLTVSAPVSATGDVTLSTEAVIGRRTDGTSLLLAANVSGGTVRFDTTDGEGGQNGVLQTAGIVTATTLTGVASTLSLPQANQITNLGAFTTTGALSLTDGRALAVTGAVSSGVLTLNAQGITQTAASSIAATELDGSASADTVLNSRLNAIRSMGTFTQSAGNFTLVTSSPELDFGGGTGQVSATTGSLTFIANAVGLVSSPAAGPRISAPNGVITFSPFTAGLPIALIGTGTPAANTLTLSTSFLGLLNTNTLALGVAGYTGAIGLGGANDAIDLSAFSALQLQTSGAVTQATGSVLTVSSLTGSAGSIVLPNKNTVASLGLGAGSTGAGLAATSGPLTLTTVGSLSVYGPVSASTAVTLTTGSGTTAGLTVVGSLTAPTVTLSAGGAVSESSTAALISATNLAITAGSASLTGTGNRIGGLSSTVSGNLTLTDATSLTISNGSTIGGTLNLTVGGTLSGGPFTAQTLTGTATSVALTGTNQIVTLGQFTSTSGFSLADAQALIVAGPVSDSTAISLNATGNLTLAGSLTSALGAVTLVSSGTITQTGGTITANSLTGSATSVALTAANQIASLGAFTTTSGFSLTDARALTVAGTVSDPTAIALNVSGNLAVSSSLSSPLGTVTLMSAGTITEPGGTVTAGTLTGSATSVTLTTAANKITSLGAFTTTGGFTLTDGTALTVAGAVSDPAAVSLNVTGNLTLSNSLSSPLGVVTLVSSGAISQPGGSITAGTLTATSGGSVVLAQTGNRIGMLTSAVSNDLTLTDATALTFTGGSMVGGTLTLTVAGAVNGGALTAQALTGSATSLALTSAANQITSLGPFTTTGGFSLVDARALTVAGAVSDPSAISLNTTGNLALAGSLLSPQGTVTLVSSGTITQPGGIITASTLIDTAAGSVVLSQSGNRIAALTGGVSGDLTLTDATGLSITGGSTVGGTLNLTVGGTLTGGSFAAQTLTGSATSVALTGTANQIASLGAFTTTGGFNLADARALTVAGTVSDPSAISLNVTGNLTLAGSLLSPQGAVTLVSSGAISQSGGAITASSVTGSATGSAILGQAGNSIATVAGFITGADFTLVDSRSLVVSAPVDPNTVTMTVKGDLTLNSSVTGGTVVLNATGAITEGPGGRIVADTLTGSAGSAALNAVAGSATFSDGQPNGNGTASSSGGNQITTLGAFATSTGFSLNNAGVLTVAGPVSDGASIAITAGPITLAGTVSAPAVSLNASGGITQTAGTLTAANTLTVAASGAFTQSGGNLVAGSVSGSADSVDLGRGGAASIGQIAGLAATGQSPGTLTVVDNGPLRISGTLSGRFVSVTSTGSLVLADGAVIRTDGQPASAQLGSSDASPGSNLSVRAGSNGTATLTQLGTGTIAPLNAAFATLRFDLPSSGGTVALNNLQSSNADLVLNLGSGSATGTLVARNLTVLGAGGRAVLSGSVRGLSGDAAAENSALLPALDLRYTLNGCTISVVSCTVPVTTPIPVNTANTLSTVRTFVNTDLPNSFLFADVAAIASVIRPDILTLDVLDLSVTRDREDPTLLLPNISDKDY